MQRFFKRPGSVHGPCRHHGGIRFTAQVAGFMSGQRVPNPEASEWGRRRQERRRQFSDKADRDAIVASLDKRATKNVRKRRIAFKITLTEEMLAALDARRAKWNGGDGCSRSAMIAYALADLLSGATAKEFQREWAARQAGEQEPPETSTL